MSWLSRALNVFRAGRVTDDLDEELRFHVESRARELEAAGMTPEDAYREAGRRLGNASAIRERSRDVKLLPWLEAALRDLRIGIRMIGRDAVVAAAAVASLALAIGGCTAAFALVDALILRPLPVRDPGSLVSLGVREDGRDRTSFNYPLFERLGDAVGGRAEIAAFSYQSPDTAVIHPGGPEERAYAQFVSGNAFGMLGVTPALGRLIVPADDDIGHGQRVAVLSHAFWTRRFGADPGAMGRTIVVESTPYQIVGIAKKGFTGVEPGIATSVWMPLSSTPERQSFSDAGWHWFKVLGRLEPGRSRDDVRGVMQVALTAFRRERAATWPNTARAERERFLAGQMMVRPASNGISDLRTNFERPLWILAAVVGLVLLLACSNLANLMLARGAARDREMALRLAIGAGRARLVQQMLIEAGVIAGAAAALGAGFARLAAPVIVRMLAPRDTPAFLDVRFDARVLLFAALAGVLATMAFGLLPALRASSAAPIDALKTSGTRHTSRARLLRPLVAAQMAFSLTVLFLASLLLASFTRLARVDPGFVPEGVTLVDVGLSHPSERRNGREGLLTLVDQIRSLPRVSAVGYSRWPLFGGAGWSGTVFVGGRRPSDAEVYFLEIAPGFVEAMGMRLAAGRDLVRADLDAGSPSVLVNETFARTFLAGIPPVGARFTRPERSSERAPEQQIPHEVVGVVRDAKYNDLREPTPPTVYMPLRAPRDDGDLMMTRIGGTIEVRSPLPPEAVAERVRAVAARVSPPMKVTSVTTQSTLVVNTMLRERLLALLSGFFALVSLALAAVGLYGVLSYSVVQQTREIGIRMALGAARRRVVRGVVGDVALYVLAGMALGLGAGLWLSRFLARLLYEVRPGDAATITFPVALLLVVAGAAALLPARRAAGVDPMVALRDE